MNEQGGSPPSPLALVWLAILFLLVAGAQSAIVGRLPLPTGAEPDLVMTLALVAALLSDAATGAWVGLFAGLVTSALVGQTVGTYLVSRTLAGFAAGNATARLFRGNIAVVLVGVLLASLVSEAIYLLAAPRMVLAHGVGTAARTAALSAVANAVCALPLLFILRLCGWGERR